MTYTLEMIFNCVDGSTSSLYVKNAIPTLTSAAAAVAGQAIAGASVFTNSQGIAFDTYKESKMIIEQPLV